MNSPAIYTIPLVAPALYLAFAAILLRRPNHWPTWLAWLPVAGAFLSLGVLIAEGPGQSQLLGLAGVGISVRLDALSAIMSLLVTFLGASVLHFSRQYLAGDPGHGRFMAELALTLAAVTMLVSAGNLYLMVAAWVAMSLLLNRLLLFRRERLMARIAAGKKFVLARIGDASLIVACGLLIAEFGTAELGALTAAIAASGEASGAALAAAILLALTAVLKSAQFPTHGWLVEVMETPTPVSALLHAGIVNAGGFLFLRFADLMTAFPAVGLTVAVIGAVTALVGSAIMLTQPSIKSALAYSTVGQMGFMMLQCGLGAYTAAVVHLVGHSLYKAHAFLSSGDVVSRMRREGWRAEARRGAWPGRLATLGVLGVGYTWVANAVDFGWQAQPVIFSLGWILLLGLWMLVGAPARSLRLQLRLLTGAFGAAAAYFIIQLLAAAALSGMLSPPPDPGTAGRVVLLTVLAASTGLALLQTVAADRLQRLRLHLSRGLYINLFVNRWLGAYRAESISNR